MPDPVPPAPTPEPPRKPRIPPPPGKADLDQVSQDQALITDEWTGDPPRPDPERGGAARGR